VSPSLQDACLRWADRPALIHRGLTLTYAGLWERILALSWSYHSLGIRPGDRVMCQLPTSPEHLTAIGAAWAAGAIHVGAHPDLTASELSDLVARTGAGALLFAPGRGAEDPRVVLESVRAAHPSLLMISHDVDSDAADHRLSELLAARGSQAEPPFPSGPEDAALLVFTSGTTGTPKAVIETLPALWSKLELFARAIAPTPEDVHLVYLPINHIFGLKLALMALASGGCVLLQDRFSPGAALSLAREHGVTVLPGTPTHLTLLLRHLRRDPHALAAVRCIPFAAAPPPPVLIEQLYERLDAGLVHIYGCSEGFVTLTTDPAEIRRGAVGSTVFEGPPGTPPTGTVAIVDPDSGAILSPDALGEIAFGIKVPVRYWGGPRAGADGWYRTGDLGWLDARGCLTVSGRIRDVVNRGGMKVACAEVEAALAGHPELEECAVIATPDEILGEAICACVVPAGTHVPSLAELRSHFSRRLAPHKLPDELCVVPSLPRSKLGKLDRVALTALVVGENLPRERLIPRPRRRLGEG
jgi:acyl-CoA synthetase (AMP-forming)/AMP-acid ligase II